MPAAKALAFYCSDVKLSSRLTRGFRCARLMGVFFPRVLRFSHSSPGIFRTGSSPARRSDRAVAGPAALSAPPPTFPNQSIPKLSSLSLSLSLSLSRPLPLPLVFPMAPFDFYVIDWSHWPITTRHCHANILQSKHWTGTTRTTYVHISGLAFYFTAFHRFWPFSGSVV